MFENIVNFFKNIGKKEENKKIQESSKDAAKERLHLVLKKMKMEQKELQHYTQIFLFLI